MFGWLWHTNIVLEGGYDRCEGKVDNPTYFRQRNALSLHRELFVRTFSHANGLETGPGSRSREEVLAIDQ